MKKDYNYSCILSMIGLVNRMNLTKDQKIKIIRLIIAQFK